jgi:hypothetical protein
MPAKKNKGGKKKSKKVMGSTPGRAEARDPGAASMSLGPATRGDVIVVDSNQVGSPTREGEVLQVIEGAVRVSYRVRWLDGHESLISPTGGSIQVSK